MIKDTIKKTISSHKLLNKGDRVLIGLSGGADSVCLTNALYALSKELGITVFTAHVNHGIRGREAQRDEEFAKNFSNSLGIECFTMRADIPKIAEEKGLSEELAGRQIRYDFFKKLCEMHGIDKIATAHNKNDNAETIVMNFMRGSGVNGLCGIPYKRGNIIRPLLDADRGQIEEYCRENMLSYMTDSTNSELLYTRNKIRHTLIPLIQKEFNPSFISTVATNAVMLKEDSEYIEKKADEAYAAVVSDNTADADKLLKLDVSLRRRVVRRMIGDTNKGLNDIPAIYVNDALSLLKKESGASVNLKDGIIAKIEYGRLIIEHKKMAAEPFEYKLGCNSSGIAPEISAEIIISVADERKNDGAIYISCGEDSIITVRNRRSGDKFNPVGMTGSKKVKELFINEKIPREKRDIIPIIEVDGKIAAVGNRIDRGFLFGNKGIRIEFKPL